MTTVHVTSGLPGSGKSTLAKELWPALRLSMDDIRAALGITHERWTKELEHAAFNAYMAAAISLVKDGHDIVLDNVHATPAWPKRYRKELGPLVEFVVHNLMDVSIEECIARDAAREDGVGEEVIRKLADRYEESRKTKWRLKESWINVPKYAPPVAYEGTPGAREAFLCDIDGTVALHDGLRGRSHYDYDRVMDDDPNVPIIAIVQRLAQTGIGVVFCSGREARCYDDTLAWLDKFVLPKTDRYFYGLLMRTTGDHRPDDIIKTELFDAHIRDNYDIQFVLDDRDRVVKMWRAMGLRCLQVADGDF